MYLSHTCIYCNPIYTHKGIKLLCHVFNMFWFEALLWLGGVADFTLDHFLPFTSNIWPVQIWMKCIQNYIRHSTSSQLHHFLDGGCTGCREVGITTSQVQIFFGWWSPSHLLQFNQLYIAYSTYMYLYIAYSTYNFHEFPWVVVTFCCKISWKSWAEAPWVLGPDGPGSAQLDWIESGRGFPACHQRSLGNPHWARKKAWGNSKLRIFQP